MLTRRCRQGRPTTPSAEALSCFGRLASKTGLLDDNACRILRAHTIIEAN